MGYNIHSLILQERKIPDPKDSINRRKNNKSEIPCGKRWKGTVLHGKKTITNSKLKDTMGTMAFDPSRGSWIWVGGQPVCNSEVQDSQGHIARLPLLKKENENRKVLIANAQESKGQWYQFPGIIRSARGLKTASAKIN